MMPKPVTQGALERLQALAAGGTMFDRAAPAGEAQAAADPIGVQMAGEAIAAARRESLAAFGDGAVLRGAHRVGQCG
mgnify:CR=1 FL=1